MNIRNSGISFRPKGTRKKHTDIQKIPCIVVDDVNEIVASLRDEKIHAENLALLHLSCRPHMLNNNPCKQGSNKAASDGLYNDWILYLLANKTVNSVLWLKPEWSDQLSPRSLTPYQIGSLTSNVNKLSLTCPDPYFIENGVYAAKRELVYPIDFNFSVEWLHPMHTSCRPCQELLTFLRSQPFMLNIDLDIFLLNSFLRLKFTEQECDLIDRLHAWDSTIGKGSATDSVGMSDGRQQLAIWLDDIMKRRPVPSEDPRVQLLQRLCNSVLTANEGKYDSLSTTPLDCLLSMWKTGTCLDSLAESCFSTNGHVIQPYIEAMEGLLNRLENPRVITISRCLKSGHYLNQNQSDMLKEIVVKTLNQVYGKNMLRFSGNNTAPSFSHSALVKADEQRYARSLPSSLCDGIGGENEPAGTPRKGIF